jgi:aromatic aminotransferase
MTKATPSINTKDPQLSPRILETLDPCVVLMKELIGRYSHLWEDQGGIFSLAQGIVYWEPPPTCQQRLQNEVNKGFGSNALHLYGPAQGIPELVQALTQKLARENEMFNHDIMVTVGANQAYVNVVLTCMGEGGSRDDKDTVSSSSKAIVFAPYYFNHVMALQMCCGPNSVIIGPCTEDGIPNLKWLETTLQTNPNIRMVTIVNPGNPTGVSLQRHILQQAANLCRTHGAWLVLDCTYEYFTQSPEDQPIASLPNESHVIHIFSFSKSYSLAGFRCGYVVLSKDSMSSNAAAANTSTSVDASLLFSNMVKVQDTLPIAAPRISQLAALGALEAGPQWVRDQFATLTGSRKAIRAALAPLNGAIMGGSGAMYFMAQLPIPQSSSSSSSSSRGSNTSKEGCRNEKGNGTEQQPQPPPHDDVEVCRRLVEEYGIAVIPGSYCGFPGWIRVCYANLTPDECLEAAERLKKGLIGILINKKEEL